MEKPRPETQNTILKENPETTNVQNLKKTEILLSNIVQDRLLLKDAEFKTPETPLIDLEKNPTETQTENLRLLNMLSGETGLRLRSLVNSTANPNPTIEHLKTLYNWSNQISPNNPPNLETLNQEPPELIKDQPEWQVIQRVIFSRQFPETNPQNYETLLYEKTSEALKLQNNQKTEHRKWVDLLPSALGPLSKEKNETAQDRQKKITQLLSKVGFIPRELTESQKYQNYGADTLTLAINTLSAIESQNKDNLHDIARRERSKLLNTLLQSENKIEQLKNQRLNLQIKLDSNGLLLKSGSEPNGLFSHLPYSLIEPKSLETLKKYQSKQEGFLPSAHLEETEIRIEQGRGNYHQQNQLEQQQLVKFYNAVNNTDNPIRKNILENTHETDYKTILSKTNKEHWDSLPYYSEPIFEKQLIIPKLWAEEILKTPRGQLALLELGENITTLISKEDLSHWQNNLQTYKMTGKADASYHAREKLLNNPNYYNIAKIAKTILSNQPTEQSPVHKAFYRGSIGESKRHQRHDFLEIIQEGQIGRILIDKKKHLTNKERELLSRIPEYKPQNYKLLEDTVQVYSNYITKFQNAKLHSDYWASARYSDFDTKTISQIQKSFLYSCEYMLYFMQSSASGITSTETYNKANQTYLSLLETDRAGQNLPQDEMKQLIEIFENTKINYENFLYTHIQTPEEFETQVKGQVHISQINFQTDNYYTKAKKICVDYGLNPDLCKNPETIIVAEISLSKNNPSETIPYTQELEALQAIKLDTHKPMIMVVGGAKYLDSKEANNPSSAQNIAKIICRVGHKFQANLSVPGTQSGIGIAFGEENITYLSDYYHLPSKDRMNMFAITPSGNIYINTEQKYPDKDQEIYGITPVNTIATPNRGGWHAVGKEKENSPYIRHSAHAGAIQNRASKEQPRLVTLSDGGYYSIIDAMEFLRHGMPLVIIKKTGRLAEATACIIENLPEIPNTASLEAWQKIRETLDAHMSVEERTSFYKKDFGDNTTDSNENYEVYRKKFLEFVNFVKSMQSENKPRVFITEPENLERKLEEILNPNTFPSEWK